MIYRVFFILLLINIISLLFHESTNLLPIEQINAFISQSKLHNSIYVDIYSETNNIQTGRDNRLAIVQPFNWYIFNSRSNIYIHSFHNSCSGNSESFVKLNNPLTGNSFQNLREVCLPFSISTMVIYFSEQIKTRIHINLKREIITVIDIVNELLLAGVITNSHLA